MSDPFGGDLFGGGNPFGTNRPSVPKNKKEEKGLPWEATTINGEWYIPLRQVAELLKQNDILPKVRRGIEDRVLLKQQQKDLDGI